MQLIIIYTKVNEHTRYKKVRVNCKLNYCIELVNHVIVNKSSLCGKSSLKHEIFYA